MGGENRLNFDVLIAGGGFAGVYCAQTLARELGEAARERVGMVADHNYMVFQPMLAEVAGSSVSAYHVVSPIRSLCRHVNVMRGSIMEIDLAGRTLTLTAGKFTPRVTIGFKHLVVALGGVIDLSRVPGMPEHAYIMKSVGDAQQLRGAILDRLEEAVLQTDEEMVKRLLTFVIVGGGFSGVETAGQVQDLLQDILRFYPRIGRAHYRVVLVHSGGHLLPEISEDLGRYCEKNLAGRGIEIILNTRVSAMTASKVTLGDGRVLESYTVVSTVGNAPHPLLLDLCKKNKVPTEKARIITDATLRVQGFENLWAAGDCAAVPMAVPKGMAQDGKSNAPMPGSPFAPKQYCPATAQFAFRQGICLGKNLGDILKGASRPPATFTFTGMGELASIGHESAVADIMGHRFSGLIAWLMWRAIYLMKLPGLDRKVRVLIDWTLDLFFRRDVTLLQAKATEVLQEMHLEKGDAVFHAGEPALSFYVVKQGRIEGKDEDGTLVTWGAGEYFGDPAVMQALKWRFTATATEPSTLVVLDAKILQAISSASVSIQEFFKHSSQQFASRKQMDALKSRIPEAILKLKVSEVMSRNPTVFRTNETVGEAIAKMVEHRFNAYPLLDEKEKLLGIVSQTEVYDGLRSGEITRESKVDQLKPETVPMVRADALITECIDTLMRTGRDRCLIVDEAGKLAGVLTTLDIIARGEGGK